MELQIICINLESSANMYMVDDTRQSGKSFIYSKNNRGPKILPWGTPDSTGKRDKVVLPTLTHCCLSYK